MKDLLESVNPDTFECLAADLESRQLVVVLVPAPRPAHTDHCIRVAADTPPTWFRRLCRANPGADYTSVRRGEILRVLRCLATGKTTRSRHVPSLVRIACQFQLRAAA